MHKLKLIIFDVDGTMADTERYGHLPACNEAMAAMGLDIVWSWDDFMPMIHSIPGSAMRLVHELEKRDATKDEIQDFVKQFEPLKKQLYIEKYLPNLKLRMGVRDLINEAVQNEIKLAVVTTSYEAQAHSLLKSKLADVYDKFIAIYGKESGKKTHNNGLLHKKCLEDLAYSASECLMIEDSEEGLDAAVCADIPTAVFYNDYTYGSAFKNAMLVAPSLEYFDLETLMLLRNLD